MPVELVEFRLCERFGWLPDELDRQDAQKIGKFITIIGLENQLQAAELKAVNRNGQH